MPGVDFSRKGAKTQRRIKSRLVRLCAFILAQHICCDWKRHGI
jgi:hypothetical protein